MPHQDKTVLVKISCKSIFPSACSLHPDKKNLPYGLPALK